MPTYIFVLFLYSLTVISCSAPPSTASEISQNYTLVTYNIENLFDADGIAVFDDYQSTDEQGETLYSSHDVLTKIQNAVQVLQMYNDGKGPDIIAMVELESDFSPANNAFADAGDFLGQFAHTTLERMLTTEFDEVIANLPSEWLLLKGMVDAGMWNYQVEIGQPEYRNGRPETVQKTAVYSRFPILREKTRIHPLERARPILETWIDINSEPLIVFTNHWKSGASNKEMEDIRLQNAEVLHSRVEQILENTPDADLVLAGDFNADYNQKARYNFPKTAVNDVLGSSGNEENVSQGMDTWYNLWYELPLEQRGSDTYRGYWGTLMQIMISSGMYDDKGLQYVDNSFARGDFGFNTFTTSGEPKRWSSTFSGSGYSDHLPVSMQFRIARKKIEIKNFSVNDDSVWSPIPVRYQQPDEYRGLAEFTAVDPRTEPDFFNEYFYLSATVTERYDVVINGITYDVYTPTFRLNEVLNTVAGTDQEISFYGRFSQFRGNWQFIIESKDFIEVNE